jgi:hypothetical protein
MSLVRTIFACALSCVALVQCGTLLSVDPIPVPADGSAPPAADGGGGDAASVDAATSKLAPIPCLGGDRPAYLCDGFDDLANGIGSSWTPLLRGDGGEVSIKPGPAAHGAGSLDSAFDPKPTDGLAKVAFKRNGSGPLAVQFSVNLVKDAWDTSEVVDIAAFRSGDEVAVLRFYPGPSGIGDGTMRVHTKDKDFEVGTTVQDTFKCYQLAWRDGSFSAHTKDGTGDSAPFRLEPDTGELGMNWPYNVGVEQDSKQVFFDDVIISDVAFGCLN